MFYIQKVVTKGVSGQNGWMKNLHAENHKFKQHANFDCPFCTIDVWAIIFFLNKVDTTFLVCSNSKWHTNVNKVDLSFD